MAEQYFRLMLYRARAIDYPKLVSVYQQKKPELDSEMIARLTELGDRYYESIYQLIETIESFGQSTHGERDILTEAYKLQTSEKRREQLQKNDFFKRINCIINLVGIPEFPQVTTLEIKNSNWSLPELVVIKSQFQQHFPYSGAGITSSDPLWVVEWNCWAIVVKWDNVFQLIPVEWLDASAVCDDF